MPGRAFNTYYFFEFSFFFNEFSIIFLCRAMLKLFCTIGPTIIIIGAQLKQFLDAGGNQTSDLLSGSWHLLIFRS